MPSFETFRECTLKEFEDYKDQRLTPEQILAGEDYTLMLAPFSGVVSMEAIAASVRCTKRPFQYRRPGIWVVNFAILDEDMLAEEEAESIYLSNDGLLELTQEFLASEPGIKDGYVRAHCDGMGGELDALLAGYDLMQKV